MVPQKCPFLSPRAEKGAGICFSCILLSHPDFPPVMSVGYGALPFHPCAAPCTQHLWGQFARIWGHCPDPYSPRSPGDSPSTADGTNLLVPTSANHQIPPRSDPIAGGTAPKPPAWRQRNPKQTGCAFLGDPELCQDIPKASRLCCKHAVIHRCLLPANILKAARFRASVMRKKCI